MTPNEFRQQGRHVVDWIAEYLETIRQRPVLPPVAPGELTAQLPTHGPESPEPMARILADFEEQIVPATTHWNHPRFHAWFANSGTPPAILAEALCAALNVNGMVWKSGPACTELEQVTLRWLAQWMGLPDSWFAMIHDTASTAGVHVLACARHRADPESRTRGNRPGYMVYCSELAHSFVDKAAMTVGFGLDAVRRVPVDAAFRLQPHALAGMIAADRARGLLPVCIVATVGTTGVASVDPVPEIAAISAREKMWLHVDAAYGGAAAVSERYRHHLAGAELADSFVVNPHKWLLTPSDLCAFYTRDPATLRAAFSVAPEFLRTAEHPAAVNMMDYSFQLGRRFRALKLWFVMRSYGRQGMAAVIESHCEMAAGFARRLLADGRFEVVAPVEFSLVCFRYRGSDGDNRALLEAINATGHAFLSHGAVDGRYALRMAIGNWQTTPEDVASVFDLIRELAPSLKQ